MSNECLLYAVFACSAEMLSQQGDNNDPDMPQLTRASRHYLVLALSEQRRAVAELTSQSQPDPTLAMAVCQSSCLIVLSSFVNLRGRSLEQYSLPLDWLLMSQGTGVVFYTIAHTENSFERMSDVFGGAAIGLMRPELQEPGMCDTLDPQGHAILQYLDPNEDMTQDDYRAYEKALIYIAFIFRCIQRGDLPWQIGLRFLSWPSQIPGRFIEMLREHRPRALAVLARALSAPARTTLYWQQTAQDELNAVMTLLPSNLASLI